MNFWADLADEVSRWNNSIGTREDCPDIYRDQLNAWFETHRQEGDAVCEYWIENRRWPEMSTDLRWQMAMRFSHAAILALTLATKNWPPPWPSAHNEALRWLLIETWCATSV